MPRIQPVLREFERRKKEEAWIVAREKVAVTREFLDEQFIFRLVNMKTHPKLGDMSVVKMIEVGYKRTGDIRGLASPLERTQTTVGGFRFPLEMPSRGLPDRSQDRQLS